MVRSCFSNGIVASSSRIDHLGEFGGAQGVGGGELLELVVDAGALAQARGVEDLERPPVPVDGRARSNRA